MFQNEEYKKEPVESVALVCMRLREIEPEVEGTERKERLVREASWKNVAGHSNCSSLRSPYLSSPLHEKPAKGVLVTEG